MYNIRLADAKIRIDDEWLSEDELAQRIQTKIEQNDLKFASLADALESLKQALENCHTIEETIVLSRQDYEKLNTIDQGDDSERVHKAVMAYIGKKGGSFAASSPKGATAEYIRCPKCKKAFEVQTRERPIVVDCPHCGTSSRLSI